MHLNDLLPSAVQGRVEQLVQITPGQDSVDIAFSEIRTALRSHSRGLFCSFHRIGHRGWDTSRSPVSGMPMQLTYFTCYDDLETVGYEESGEEILKDSGIRGFGW